MARRDLTQEEIDKRIANGDLVVYVDEEYGFRHWYWFPEMTKEELEAYWEKCPVEEYYFAPSRLPGDMVPVPPEYFQAAASEEIPDEYYDRAFSDPRSRLLISAMFGKASREEKDAMIKQHDEWNEEFFPNQGAWDKGWHSKDTWRAHVHMEDDSWLKRPGQSLYKS